MSSETKVIARLYLVLFLSLVFCIVTLFVKKDNIRTAHGQEQTQVISGKAE